MTNTNATRRTPLRIQVRAAELRRAGWEPSLAMARAEAEDRARTSARIRAAAKGSR